MSVPWMPRQVRSSMRLREEGLAERFAVSRIVVRQALARPRRDAFAAYRETGIPQVSGAGAGKLRKGRKTTP